MSAGTFFKRIATLWFVGYLPKAPGTWGSLTGLFFAWLMPASPLLLPAVILAGTCLGIIAATAAEKAIGEADSGHIVIDEFIGYLVSVVFVPHTFGYLVAAFLLFRFFDILKPFPIRAVEKKLSGGAGIMADDILAGIVVNLVLQIWKMSF